MSNTKPPRLPHGVIAIMALVLVALWVAVPLGIGHLLRAAHEPVREQVIDDQVMKRELFAPDGTRVAVERYDDQGRRHGEHRAWDASGRLRFAHRYDHGVPIGTWVIWSGERRVEIDHRGGQPVAKRRYLGAVRHGRSTEWDAQGAVAGVSWWRWDRQVAAPGS